MLWPTRSHHFTLAFFYFWKERAVEFTEENTLKEDTRTKRYASLTGMKIKVQEEVEFL